MARLDNGIMDLSQPVSDIEIALRDYVYQPRRGLEKFQAALLSLQNATQSHRAFVLFHQRLSSLLTAIDELLLAGSPYYSHYHSAFLSAADALLQVLIAARFAAERAQQFDDLLSSDRSCWSLIRSIASDNDTSLTYRNYEARLEAGQLNVMSVDAYLEAFSSAGRVSFQLDSVKDSQLNGRFSLISVQSLSWLKRRFPTLHWKVLSVNEKEPLRDLCELSFLPLFQNVTLSRDSRYRLLALFEERFKALFYQEFGSFFPNLINVDQAKRLVPCDNHISTFEQDNHVSYFPVRHGGYVYIGRRGADEESNLFYVKCLGRDYLSYFLYEVDTSFGKIVFAQQECIGRYKVEVGDLLIEGESIYFAPEDHIRAEVILNMPIFAGQHSFYCPLAEGINQLLVVKQGESYFAVPYDSVREREAICVTMSMPRSWVKNIWLTQMGEVLFEPWLLNNKAQPKLGGWPEKNKSSYPAKNGYYSGKLCGRMFWIEAELIMAILPYKKPNEMVCFENDKFHSMAFFIHEGRSFDKVMSLSSESEALSFSKDEMAFSVVLEWMSESVVLPFASFKWSATLTPNGDICDFTLPSDEMLKGYENIKNHFDSLPKGDLVINKKNFLSFVAGFWPTSSLA